MSVILDIQEKKSKPMLVIASSLKLIGYDADVKIYVGDNRNDKVFDGIFEGGEYSPAFSVAFNVGFVEVTGLVVGSYIQFVFNDEPSTPPRLVWGDDVLLITPMEVALLARPIYTDEPKTVRYIIEAELNNVKPALGDDLYLKVKEDRSDVVLHEGGVYERGGKRYHIAGLKRALAYYVTARLMESSSIEMTRQGVVVRRSEYSDEADRRAVIDASRELYAIADRYMEECKMFLEGGCGTSNDVNNNRTKIRIIGS